MLPGSPSRWYSAWPWAAESHRKASVFCYIDDVHALLPNESSSPSTREGNDSGFAWKIFVVGVLVVGGVFYFWSGHTSGPGGPPARASLPFGVEEQAYVPRIEIQNILLSRAENFIHQEVTSLSAELVNGGPRTIAGLELTVEFSDELHQVILRESRTVLSVREPTMPPGEHRSFEISFDHIPPTWNMQQPVVRITGLQFASAIK